MNAFHWRTQPSVTAKTLQPEAPSDMYPQKAYYWRKKAGLTGSRDKPVRGWRDAVQQLRT